MPDRSPAARPILDAWRRRTRNRFRTDGPWSVLSSWVGFALALALAVPITNEMFMGWVSGPASQHHDAIQALLLRSGLVVTGWIALDTYSALIRDGDRDVLALWPIDPAAVVRFEVLRLGLGKLWMVAATGVLFLPVLQISPLLWALTLVHTLVTGAFALALSTLVVLFAVDASDSPSIRPLLDLVRGQNHPAQAAFIYAPALVLAAGTAMSVLAAAGVAWIAGGALLGWAALLAPLPAAIVVGAFVAPVARRNWFRAGHVMAEVDARYALLEDQEERLGVYLDWSVRFLPTRIGLYALRDLRHGWRQRRTWISGAWLAGLLALATGWTDDPAALGRSAVVVAVASWWLSAVSLRLAADEPDFLTAWLPPDRAEQTLARIFVVGLWLAPVVGLAGLGALFWQGFAGLGLVLLVGGLSALVAAGSGALLARRGWFVYGPLAALASLITARGVWG